MGQEKNYCTVSTQSVHKKHVLLKEEMRADFKTLFVDLIAILDQEQH
jgi:hypothetical protein